MSCSVISLSNFLRWVDTRVHFHFVLLLLFWLSRFLHPPDLVFPSNLRVLRYGNSFRSIPISFHNRLANWCLLFIRGHVPLLGSSSSPLGTSLQAHSQEASWILSSIRFSSWICSSSWSFHLRCWNYRRSFLTLRFNQEFTHLNSLPLDCFTFIPSYWRSFWLWFPNLNA